MSSMEITLKYETQSGAGEITLDVDFDFQEGSPTTYSPRFGASGGDACEVSIERIWWPYQRWEKLQGDTPGHWVDDCHDMPGAEVHTSLREAIEAVIAEQYEPEPDEPEWRGE